MTSVYLDENTASVSSADLATAITFTIPNGSNFYLKELTINPDTTFQGSGTWQLFINGQSYMTSAKPLPTALSIELWTFNKGKGMWVKPGDKITISAACSSGTGIITAVVYGESTDEVN